jgi:hypothetical protein
VIEAGKITTVIMPSTRENYGFEGGGNGGGAFSGEQFVLLVVAIATP